MKREVRADKEAVLSAFTPGDWMGKAEILAATGLEKVNYVLDRLIIEKKLIARGATTTRQWALAGTKDTVAAAPSLPDTEDPVEPAAGELDPEDFIPAMATDRRMVLVRRGVVMILSTEETQAVADLVFENFEAA